MCHQLANTEGSGGGRWRPMPGQAPTSYPKLGKFGGGGGGGRRKQDRAKAVTGNEGKLWTGPKE